MADVKLTAHFGDMVENGWASEANPTRRGYFVREGRRTGKMNPGRYWEITDRKGKFWELMPYGDHKITVTSSHEEADAVQAAVHADNLREIAEWLSSQGKAVAAEQCQAAAGFLEAALQPWGGES